MAHPDNGTVADAVKQRVALFDVAQMCAAVFSCSCRFDLSSIPVTYKLRTVADAQHRQHAGGEGRGRAAGNGKERPDGQIQRAGESNAVTAADLAGQFY